MIEKNDLMEKIISLCKRRGFVYPASDIYGGFANAYEYGPLGVQVKKNISDFWWKRFVTERDDIVGMDSSIIENPKVWQASGHLNSFSDPLVECKKCHKRFREDHVAEAENRKQQSENSLTGEQKAMIKCEKGGEHEFADAKDFNLMFKTFVGVTEDSVDTAYMRPETAQGMFINFKNVTQSTRVKIPFGIAQVGKAFRNEITPGNFIFRTREFEQMEIEYFIKDDIEQSAKWFEYWLIEWKNFFLDLGVKEENLTIRAHDKDELSHYSAGTSDIEYRFPFGVSELAGVAQRTNFDLTEHAKLSGQDLQYIDEINNEKFIPYVVEPTMGLNRAMLALLCDAYDESDGSDGRGAGEVTMRFDPKIAPVKVAVFPLVKKENLPEMAGEIVKKMKKAGISAFYDESGSVGRRYRRQDEIGTPWCVTVDFDSLTDKMVTLRDRDSMKQERVSTDDIVGLIQSKLI
ncbi:MAG: glycine--tRNA ligase [Candidatus Berkelbacteria bacterium]